VILGMGRRLLILAAAMALGTFPAAGGPPARVRPARAAGPDPWLRTFPGPEPVPGLSELEKAEAREFERDPKAPRTPEVKLLMDAWAEQRRRERVMASLPCQAGPADIALGETARLALPEGFTFVDAKGVEAYFHALGRRVPPQASFETRLGTVTTTDRTCLAEITLLVLGHTDDRQPIPADEILKEWNGHRGEASMALDRLQHPDAPFVMPRTVQWLLPPVVDPRRHTLAWARTGDPSLGEHDLYSFVLFGKDRCLLLEFPYPPGAEGMEAFQARLRPLLDGLAFLPGWAYGDHQGPAGKLTMRVLVRGPETAAERKTEALGEVPAVAARNEPEWGYILGLVARVAGLLSILVVTVAAWRARRRARVRKR